MKIRSLFLGSIAAAGLVATGAHAADLGVATSLDVCDALGLSGLTISSDSNCLQITGHIEYEFDYGNYKNNSTYGVWGDDATSVDNNIDTIGQTSGQDWQSKMITWLKFVGTADSDMGPAKAVITLRNEQYYKSYNSVISHDGDDTGYYDTNGDYQLGVALDEAYVSVGDTTVLMAGKKGSIKNIGDDEPFNWLGTFNSSEVDTNGVLYKADVETGGTSIQIVSDLGNGVSVGAGLEDIADDGSANTGIGFASSTGTIGSKSAQRAGTLVGVLSYAGDNISAHITGFATGVLDGTVDNYAYHAGFTGSFDAFKLRAAVAGDDGGYVNALASAQATFDIFTLAATVEAVHYGDNTAIGLAADPSTYPYGGQGSFDAAKNGTTDVGFGASFAAMVTDGVTLNVGGRYYHEAASSAGTTVGWGGGENNVWQVEAALSTALTETIKLTGQVGAISSDRLAANPDTDRTVFYGGAGLAWAPGGGFTSSLGATVNSAGGYKATFKAAKDFQ